MPKIYKETVESTELYIYTLNTRQCYDYMRYMCGLLLKKKRKGVYDAAKAVNAFYHVATYASQQYCKEWCPDTPYYKVFTVSDRYTVACDIVELELSEFFEWEEKQ